MKKILKSKLLFLFIGIILGSTSIVLAYSLFANNIGFTPKDSSWNVDNAEAAINDLHNSCVYCDERMIGYEWNFAYTGKQNLFISPCKGIYKIELWGAQGAGITSQNLGGYTSGIIELKNNSKLHVYVGQQGNQSRTTIFNGGGIGGTGGSNGYSGGGATDVRLIEGTWNNSDSLNSRIMVAAGGAGSGGSSDYERSGEKGSAGGLIGYTGGYYPGHTYVNQNGKGGTQISGGTAGSNHFSASGVTNSGSFGIGGSSYNNSSNTGSGGGGGGYYGGGAGGGTLSGGCGQGGGGGSSYISGHIGCVATKSSLDTSPKENCTTGTGNIECSYHYSGYKFSDTKMIDGKGFEWTTSKQSKTGMPKVIDSGVENGHLGDGFAKITLISIK